MEILQMLETLCAAPGVSGCETAALEAVNRCAEEAGLRFAPQGALSSLKAVINPHSDAENGVLLLAHIDKIGCMVTGIDEATGFLRIFPAGGCDARVAPASRVTVYGRRPLPGVIVSTPPHLVKKEDAKTALPLEKLTVDCGLPYEEIAALVFPGDRVQFDAPVLPLAGGRIAAPYLDNCAGVAAVLLAAKALRGKTNRRVELVLTAQEETGRRGAVTAAFASQCPTALAVDVTFAAAPGVKEQESAPLGSGARIGVAPILSRAVSQGLIEAAEKNGVPYTVEVMGRSTGTDADMAGIAGCGKRTGLVSIPVRNMHTPAETVDPADIEAAAALIWRYIAC